MCVCRRIYMHIIEPVLPHIIYSAARWNAILSARGYISLIHRTTITTHLIPECSLLKKNKNKKKSKRQGEREHRSKIKCMRKKEWIREQDKNTSFGGRLKSKEQSLFFNRCRTNCAETSTYILNTAPTTGDTWVTDGTGDTLMMSVHEFESGGYHQP